MAVEYLDSPLPQKPRLVPWVSFVDLGDKRLQFRAPQYIYTLHSEIFINSFKAIKFLLDGNHSVEEISSSGGAKNSPTTILFLLKMLRANGLLQEGNVSPPPPLGPDDILENERQLSFLSHFVLDSQAVLTSLRKSRVGLVGSNHLKTHIQDSLQSMGINPLQDINLLFVDREKNESSQKELAKALKGLDILIACHETEGFGFFETINQLCLETGTRWLRVAIEGTALVLGPTFVPYQNACYACYVRRIASNLPDPEDYTAYQQKVNTNNGGGDGGYFPPFWSLAASHVAIEVARILSGFAPPKTMGRFYLIEGMSPEAVGHQVLRLPRCPVCSPREPQKQAWDRSPSTNEEY